MPDKNYFSSSFKLGILGGGQLGKMLLTDTRRYDIQTKVMDPSPVAPCRFGSNEFVQGDITDKQAVLDFAKDCDVITIEIENVSTEALHELEAQGKIIYPRPRTLDIIKNKSLQKDFYREHKVPTASYFTFENREQMMQLLLESELNPPFVWKAATGGYDGKGVSIVRNSSDIEDLPDMPGLIEEMVDYAVEIAVVVARSPSGETKSFPVVEMEFHPTANLVEYVFSPSNIDIRIQNKANQLAEEVAHKFDHVGLLAVEMFVTKDGHVMVNEVAPRVHNSGHLTIEGNVTSQFDQHLRAILDLPLGDTEIVRPAVMINLTGEADHSGPVLYEGIEKIMKSYGVSIHLYGKAETRPFRKMGHITITAKTIEEAREVAGNVNNTIKVISQ
ncbi:5-(carboxyamino)imidazole ribonucleotide synthase [Owenweeksia hongkongensis]|uniref:5-(carboxyamino)imidazole ribonucleotide synthase n=1 Tax=Owenweeksia hongkongensis TaxID=253245 RepID=UPI003A92CA71